MLFIELGLLKSHIGFILAFLCILSPNKNCGFCPASLQLLWDWISGSPVSAVLRKTGKMWTDLCMLVIMCQIIKKRIKKK